jgi:hypothetical protein
MYVSVYETEFNISDVIFESIALLCEIIYQKENKCLYIHAKY